MFKQRTARDLIRNATDAIQTGAFFSRRVADAQSSNEYARAYLYTEAMFHQFYALSVLFEEFFGRRWWWASPNFLWAEISAALVKHGSKIGPVASRRCDELHQLTQDERGAGVHLGDSARRVREMDPSIDEAQVVRAIAKATDTFLAAYRPLFEQAVKRPTSLFS